MIFRVVEKATYEVEAEDIDQAENLFILHVGDGTGYVQFVEVSDREIGEPDKPETWRETR